MNRQKVILEIKKHISDLATQKPKGYTFRIAAYKKVIDAFKKASNKMEAYNILHTVFKNPKNTKARIQSLLKITNKENSNPIQIISSVPGIGVSKAKVLVEKGIKTIEVLKQHTNQLTKQQKVALKYYDKLIDKKSLDYIRHPRCLLQTFENSFKQIIAALDIEAIIAGSYRRKEKTSKDIDIILKGESNQGLKQIVKVLFEKNLIHETLS
jgi:DNA polymerase/3'-5' exonuclease PolX